MSTLNTVNFGQTTLNGNYIAGALTMIFSTVSNMPPVPFKFSIQETEESIPDIMLATALNGSVYTVEPGQEGTVPTNHTNGAQIAVVLTSEMFSACFPNGSEVEADGTALQMEKLDFNYDVTASAAGVINLPTDPFPFKDYSITDAGNNFGTYNQMIEPLGYVMGLNDENGSTKTFYYAPIAGEWRLKI